MKEREARAWPERQIIVEINEELITAKYPQGELRKASLGALEKIEVITNDSGPWGADVWFVLTSKSGVCSFPQGATGEKEVLNFMLALEGFNKKEFIKAMGCTSNCVFLCWVSQSSASV